VTDAVGFDSSGGLGQTTFAVLNVEGGGQGLYVIDLFTGESTLLRTITAPGPYTAFAVACPTAPPAGTTSGPPPPRGGGPLRVGARTRC
jgi:hypothetical protein